MSYDHLLRFYPEEWRTRYGDEYLVLLEDVLDGEKPSLRLQVSVAWAGLVERAHAAGLLGDTTAPVERRRAGSLVVLWAWTVFVIGGCALAKRAEHAGGGQQLVAIQVFAVVSGLAVVAAGLAVLPSAARLIRAGGWRPVGRPIRRACVATLLGLAASAALVRWAHALPRTQVESGSWPYGLAFLGTALVVCTALALWTGVAVALVKRIEMSPAVRTVAGWLTTVVCLAMMAMTVAAAAWSTAANVGVIGIGVIGAVLIASDAAALYGLTRMRTT